MAKNIIFYFSGTGNSLKAAQVITERLEETELVFMKGDYALSGNYERIGFVFPCYASSVPKPVVDFIKNLNIDSLSANYIFAATTCNISSRNSLPALKFLLRKKGVILNYGESIMTVGNYIVLYDIKNTDEKHKSANEKINIIAEAIKNKISNRVKAKKVIYSIHNFLGNKFFKLNEKKFAVSNHCIECGLCQKICPTDNIRSVDSRPEFLHKNCTNCMACIHWCPKQAINCGERTKQRKRYHHPDITITQMLK